MTPKFVRIYSPFPPHKKTEGAFHVIADQARSLQEMGFEVELIHWKKEGEQEQRQDRIHRVFRSFCSSSASPELFYYPPGEDPRKTFSRTADFGIYHYSFAYSWLKQWQGSENRRFVHFHNLESDLFSLRSHFWKNPAVSLVHQMNAWKLKRHESQLSFLSDELWFLSHLDLKKFRERSQINPKCPLRHVGPTFDPTLFQKRTLKFAKSKPTELVLGLIGGYDFEPNRASLAWVIQELAPLLKKRGFQGKILIAGKGVPSSLLTEANSYGFFEFTGFLSDVEDFWSRLSFLLIPQFGGSGVRIKLLEALASGVPIMANYEALKPLSEKLQNSPLIFRSDLAAAWATRILQDQAAETRKKSSIKNFEKSLDGAEVYEFLLDS